eukprot:TRINITY_DN950_c0_g2_i1.p1 TRINITY_DN950_c0_g2~~TRINITY_DN950_c0_g2_i1.p1  ORF type:complete len:364 (+),score=77.81 TRINITY_DN950_c0_g2_i1:266-1357(+)
MTPFFTMLAGYNNIPHLLLVLFIVLLLSTTFSTVSCGTTTKTSSFYAYETQPNAQVHASSSSSSNDNPSTFSSSSHSSSSSSSISYDQSGQLKENSHASASKSQNGVTYEYTYYNGVETLTVKGGPVDFDKEAVLSDLRKSVGIKKVGTEGVNINYSKPSEDTNVPTKTQSTHSHYYTKSQSTPYQTHTFHVSSTTFEEKDGHDEHSKIDSQFSLLSSVSSFLLGSALGSNIQSLYDTLTRDENKEQLRLAETELANVEDDLSKIQTQEHILKTRQADLGAYIQQLQSNPQARNPTLDELVGIEDDRLALLENRLNRMKNKLTIQKTQLTNFIQMNQRAYSRPSANDLFNQNDKTDNEDKEEK